MSKQKKSKKERRPNLYAGASSSVAPQGLGGGAEAPVVAAASVERKSGPTFDYTHVKKDLTRIGILAGSFITVLVVLSFFLNR